MDAMHSEMTDEMFRIFHKIDRNLYSMLVFELGHDPFESVWVIALWIWLERIGFNNVVQTILSLPKSLISGLAGEATVCLKCIRDMLGVLAPAPSEILLTQRIVGKQLSLRFFLEHRVTASHGIKEVVAEVCVKALTDLMEAAIHRNTEQRFSDQMVMIPPAAQVPRTPSTQMGRPRGEALQVRPQPRTGTRGETSQARPPSNILPPEERTMFATFSKGYPVGEWEVMAFFTKLLGNCIEAIHMQAVKPHEQALYARVVFFNPEVIHLILNGQQKAKFTINGKHIWMRRFIPRGTPAPLPQYPSMNPGPYL
nr:uncharacterized protein LOC109148137 [Ipomoea batatas]GMD41138.1 uncharacterized protein LOC109148137 [Ipomoea batatas]